MLYSDKKKNNRIKLIRHSKAFRFEGPTIPFKSNAYYFGFLLETLKILYFIKRKQNLKSNLNQMC